MPKRSQASVRYRPHTVPGKMCGTCSMFVSHKGKPPSCTDVQDPIYFDGVCDIFERAHKLPAVMGVGDKSAAA